ncbi:alpha/beta fold hydrolase [Bradyrhizobium sp. STM 3562]|uniref:alpha/beta fold hydrolase n=1 Tax=Bradyrhizobium sp. STM 3562 TaxID=578924 RepID=UPI0038909187
MTQAAADPAILIHGAWQGGWVWDRLIPLLAKTAGILSVAVDLPGNGKDDVRPADVSLDLYVAHIGGVLKRLGGRASLVAHSGGGIVASAVAERFPECVSRIVYVAGMMLPSGMAFADLVAELKGDHPDAVGVAPHLIWSRDRLTSRVPMQVALAYFFHDCPVADAAAAAQRLTPQPDRGRAVRARLTPQRFGRIPRLYVEAEADRAVIPACQRRMQALVPGADVVTLPTGHAPHLAAPRLLADVLIPFLTASEDGPAFATTALRPVMQDASASSGSPRRRASRK